MAGTTQLNGCLKPVNVAKWPLFVANEALDRSINWPHIGSAPRSKIERNRQPGLFRGADRPGDCRYTCRQRPGVIPIGIGLRTFTGGFYAGQEQHQVRQPVRGSVLSRSPPVSVPESCAEVGTLRSNPPKEVSMRVKSNIKSGSRYAIAY